MIPDEPLIYKLIEKEKRKYHEIELAAKAEACVPRTVIVVFGSCRF